MSYHNNSFELISGIDYIDPQSNLTSGYGELLDEDLEGLLTKGDFISRISFEKLKKQYKISLSYEHFFNKVNSKYRDVLISLKKFKSETKEAVLKSLFPITLELYNYNLKSSWVKTANDIVRKYTRSTFSFDQFGYPDRSKTLSLMSCLLGIKKIPGMGDFVVFVMKVYAFGLVSNQLGRYVDLSLIIKNFCSSPVDYPEYIKDLRFYTFNAKYSKVKPESLSEKVSELLKMKFYPDFKSVVDWEYNKVIREDNFPCVFVEDKVVHEDYSHIKTKRIYSDKLLESFETNCRRILLARYSPIVADSLKVDDDAVTLKNSKVFLSKKTMKSFLGKKEYSKYLYKIQETIKQRAEYEKGKVKNPNNKPMYIDWQKRLDSVFKKIGRPKEDPEKLEFLIRTAPVSACNIRKTLVNEYFTRLYLRKMNQKLKKVLELLPNHTLVSSPDERVRRVGFLDKPKIKIMIDLKKNGQQVPSELILRSTSILDSIYPGHGFKKMGYLFVNKVIYYLDNGELKIWHDEPSNGLGLGNSNELETFIHLIMGLMSGLPFCLQNDDIVYMSLSSKLSEALNEDTSRIVNIYVGTGNEINDKKLCVSYSSRFKETYWIFDQNMQFSREDKSQVWYRLMFLAMLTPVHTWRKGMIFSSYQKTMWIKHLTSLVIDVAIRIWGFEFTKEEKYLPYSCGGYGFTIVRSSRLNYDKLLWNNSKNNLCNKDWSQRFSSLLTVRPKSKFNEAVKSWESHRMFDAEEYSYTIKEWERMFQSQIISLVRRDTIKEFISLDYKRKNLYKERKDFLEFELLTIQDLDRNDAIFLDYIFKYENWDKTFLSDKNREQAIWINDNQTEYHILSSLTKEEECNYLDKCRVRLLRKSRGWLMRCIKPRKIFNKSYLSVDRPNVPFNNKRFIENTLISPYMILEWESRTLKKFIQIKPALNWSLKQVERMSQHTRTFMAVLTEKVKNHTFSKKSVFWAKNKKLFSRLIWMNDCYVQADPDPKIDTDRYNFLTKGIVDQEMVEEDVFNDNLPELTDEELVEYMKLKLPVLDLGDQDLPKISEDDIGEILKESIKAVQEKERNDRLKKDDEIVGDKDSDESDEEPESKLDLEELEQDLELSEEDNPKSVSKEDEEDLEQEIELEDEDRSEEDIEQDIDEDC